MGAARGRTRESCQIHNLCGIVGTPPLLALGSKEWLALLLLLLTESPHTHTHKQQGGALLWPAEKEREGEGEWEWESLLAAIVPSVPGLVCQSERGY